MSDDSGVTLALLRQMLNANDPDDVARHAREWKDLARELYEVVRDVDGVLSDLDGSFDSQHAAPALKAKLVEAMTDLDVTAGRIDRNGNVIDQAADAHRRARDAANNANSDSDAQPIRSALSEEHAALAAQLDTFPDADPRGGGGSPPGDGADRPGGTGGGSGSDGGGGGITAPASSPGTGGGRAPTSVRFNPGPTLGVRTPTSGGKLGPGTGIGTSGTRLGAGIGTGAGAGAGGGARVGLPGVRSGVPIGGYRPVAGTPGTGGAAGGSTPPGGSAPGKAGPGGPGRPGAVPPGGAGPGQPGRDRPGRRLTRYEKLEPNVFRDTRHRVKPVIGEQRRQPDTFDPTPGAIGGKQTGEETRKTPDMPTQESPMRFEGHDMSVSRRSRRAGP